MLRVTEAAKALGVNPAKVHEWLEEGILWAICISENPNGQRQHIRMCAFTVAAVWLEFQATPKQAAATWARRRADVEWFRADLGKRADYGELRARIGSRRRG